MVANLAWLLLVLTLGLLSPGPDFMLIVRNSVGTPRAFAFGTVAGIAAGIAVQMLVISFGFVAAPPAALRAVQFAGAAFLAYLGLRALLAAPRTAGAAVPDPGTRGGFLQGLLCNLTNPKAFLFFVALFAQTLRPDTTLGWRLALAAAVVLHGAAAWSLVVTALQSAPVARRLERAQRWLPRAFGAALVGLAAVVLAEVWRG